MNKQSLCLCKTAASDCFRWAFRWSAFALGCFLLPAVALRADSLWSERATPRPMVSDKRAIAIGDILSIVVQESSVASKDNSTQTSKKTGLDASISSFLYSPQASSLLTKGGKLPALKFDAKHDFDGSGKI